MNLHHFQNIRSICSMVHFLRDPKYNQFFSLKTWSFSHPSKLFMTSLSWVFVGIGIRADTETNKIHDIKKILSSFQTFLNTNWATKLFDTVIVDSINSSVPHCWSLKPAFHESSKTSHTVPVAFKSAVFNRLLARDPAVVQTWINARVICLRLNSFKSLSFIFNLVLIKMGNFSCKIFRLDWRTGTPVHMCKVVGCTVARRP